MSKVRPLCITPTSPFLDPKGLEIHIYDGEMGRRAYHSSIRPGLDESHHLAVSLPSPSTLSPECCHHRATINELKQQVSVLIPSTMDHVTSIHPSPTSYVFIRSPSCSEAVLSGLCVLDEPTSFP